jgi:hypothetical protein
MKENAIKIVNNTNSKILFQENAKIVTFHVKDVLGKETKIVLSVV